MIFFSFIINRITTPFVLPALRPDLVGSIEISSLTLYYNEQ